MNQEVLIDLVSDDEDDVAIDSPTTTDISETGLQNSDSSVSDVVIEPELNPQVIGGASIPGQSEVFDEETPGPKLSIRLCYAFVAVLTIGFAIEAMRKQN